jgi:HD-GYP domain-containing protein (c-di-GMP phosphodiesterase class II)
MQAHCLAAGDLAERLELGDEVRQPLLQAFERWDGKGTPGKARADELAPAIRVVHLADTVEVIQRLQGVDAAIDVLEQRRGTRFDPDLVDRFRDSHDRILDGLDDALTWDEVIACDPTLGRTLTDDEVEVALEALADFADLKSPCRTGHSRGVADLARDAAIQLGLPSSDVTMIRRSALVHDIGMIGVPSGVWDETRPWSEAQRERARTHPYLTERMLARSPVLSVIGQCAALHHERLDGSGYPRGLHGDAIPLPARIVAAADVYHALGEPRPHRGPHSRSEAEAIMREEVRSGRLDGQAVNAVLAAAGHRVNRRAELPGGLTPREAEVLVALARGNTNPEIAHELGVSRKTVSAHLEHIYTKLGVSSRTEAALFAMRHGLVGTEFSGGTET